MRRAIAAMAFAAALAGCATADIVSREGDFVTVRVDDVDSIPITSRADIDRALASRASEACPNGFEKIDERTEYRQPYNPLLVEYTAVEWRVRCR